jgi:hypothetical protein
MSAFAIGGKRLPRLLVAFLFSLSWLGGSAHAQDLFTTLYPYGGDNLPLDFSKQIFAVTMPELCPQRTDGELIQGSIWPPNLIYVGWLTGLAAVSSSITTPVVTTTPLIPPNKVYCSQLLSPGNNPNVPLPQWCLMACPDNQKGTDGSCLVLSEKQSGEPCTKCGNPVNPATGNKYEAETAAVIAGGLSLTRYYHTGRATPLTRVFSGFWQHTYNRKITVGGTSSMVFPTTWMRVVGRSTKRI